MVTVADIIALPVFKSIEPIVALPGAGKRLVHNVGIMDVTPDVNEYSVYHPGEFILTNMGFCVGEPQEAERALRAMIARGVAGIAIKSVYGAHATDGMRAASEASGVPVYFYDGPYHEYVVYQALDLIQRDERDADKNDAVDALLSGHDDKATRERIRAIADVSGAAVRCLALAPRMGDDLSLYAVLSNLRSRLLGYQASRADVETAYACRYRDALLVLVSYANPQIEGTCDAEIQQVVGSVSSMRCGIGDAVPLSDGDVSVRQALMLLEETRLTGATCLQWQDVGMRAFELAAHADRLFARSSHAYESRLAECDRRTGSDLLPTARAFVSAFGEVRAAADAIHQHPNTVRYRLRKIKSLVGMEDASDRELFAFLLLMLLPRG